MLLYKRTIRYDSSLFVCLRPLCSDPCDATALTNSVLYGLGNTTGTTIRLKTAAFYVPSETLRDDAFLDQFRFSVVADYRFRDDLFSGKG